MSTYHAWIDVATEIVQRFDYRLTDIELDCDAEQRIVLIGNVFHIFLLRLRKYLVIERMTWCEFFLLDIILFTPILILRYVVINVDLEADHIAFLLIIATALPEDVKQEHKILQTQK